VLEVLGAPWVLDRCQVPFLLTEAGRLTRRTKSTSLSLSLAPLSISLYRSLSRSYLSLSLQALVTCALSLSLSLSLSRSLSPPAQSSVLEVLGAPWALDRCQVTVGSSSSSLLSSLELSGTQSL